MLDKAFTRVDNYNQNLFKAYALLWKKCSCAVRNKIVGRSNFDSKIFNNPVKLLIAIKEHFLSFQESRYEMSIITDTIIFF